MIIILSVESWKTTVAPDLSDPDVILPSFLKKQSFHYIILNCLHMVVPLAPSTEHLTNYTVPSPTH